MKKLMMLLIMLTGTFGMVYLGTLLPEYVLDDSSVYTDAVEETTEQAEIRRAIDQAKIAERSPMPKQETKNTYSTYEERAKKWRAVPEAKTKPIEKDYSLDAWCIAQRFIEQDLKCPRTVKWPWVSYSACTTNLGNGRYRCASYFDAQNGFGAMVRTNFVCIVKHKGGTQWQLESLRF